MHSSCYLRKTRRIKRSKKRLELLKENNLAQFVHTAYHVSADTKPTTEHIVMVLVLLSQASAAGYSTWDGSYDLLQQPREP